MTDTIAASQVIDAYESKIAAYRVYLAAKLETTAEDDALSIYKAAALAYDRLLADYAAQYRLSPLMAERLIGLTPYPLVRP